MNIQEIITLSELLGEMGHIKRGTRLPNGESEPDSHHSFMLALTAYEICKKLGLKIDYEKLLLFALVHDLPETVTGDVCTLNLSTEELIQKEKNDDASMPSFIKKFQDYPEIISAVKDYERLDSVEAAAVYILDKACTTWTHFPDKGAYMRRDHGLTKKHEIGGWAARKREKISRKLKVEAPEEIMRIYEQSFEELKELFDD